MLLTQTEQFFDSDSVLTIMAAVSISKVFAILQMIQNDSHVRDFLDGSRISLFSLYQQRMFCSNGNVFQNVVVFLR